ncbi:hypothetical protein [Clostridium sp. AM58-1XD]|uniref:hypothetical protein n=1 Tax=Clostridium sp. AM58-1XD TaxID=2292307 RepID=UPI000E554E2A|nr:hypothetical protein [Clostridium sp. AM58-1XD]RGY98423.1 hypothetical protein DXA13_11545 [Clostridium sp. AM58-1XD]
MREHLVKGVSDYFRGRQWCDFMEHHLIRNYGEEVYHAHLYVDTSIHPDSMYSIIPAYFEAVNRPLDRSMHAQSPRNQLGCIHGIHPTGCPHWEMIFRFNEDAVLEAMPESAPESEHGKNVLSWDRECMNQFTNDIPFKVVGPREEEAIRTYFNSWHWKKALQYVADDSVTHVHPNFEISFDPKILEIYAIEAMRKIGWTVERAVPCVFDIEGLIRKKKLTEDDPIRSYRYMGKICFTLGHPEKMFDFAWLFNPEVTIRPAQRAWISETPGFDVFYKDNYDEVIAGFPYIRLTEDEIREVIKTFYQSNPFAEIL